MKSRAIFPAAPPVSPLAEGVLMFEESDPDACALLLPFDGELTPDRVEVRARRKFPELSPREREELVSQAVAIQDIVVAEVAARGGLLPGRIAAQTVSGEEKVRRWTMLAEALELDPGMTASTGLELLNAEGGVPVADGTFHNGYWRQALERLPSQVRQLREEMTARRPGNGKLNLPSSQRAQVIQLVAVIKRDQPGWHRGQIMDEVRKRTPFQFQDPVAFGRNYVDATEPAPAEATMQVEPVQSEVNPEETPIKGSRHASAFSDQEIRENEGLESPFHALLAVADPLVPAELARTDDGRVQIGLNLQPMDAARCYRLMSLIYAEMETMELESAR
ncbi:MAG: hypothetical protein WD737_14165 [Gemmatimonadota bacterium]